MQAAIQTQIDLARGLYRSFSSVSNRLDSINDSFNRQVTLLNALTESLGKATENFGRINVKLEKLNNDLEKSLPKNAVDDIKKETKKLEKQGKKLESDVTKGLKENSKKKDGKILTAVKMSRKVFSGLSKSIKLGKQSMKSFAKATSDAGLVVEGLKEVSDNLNKTAESQESAIPTVSPLGLVLKGIFGSIKFVFGLMFKAAGMVFQFFKIINTLPYQIAKGAAIFGNALRKDIIEVLGNAYEESKNFFDATSNIGKGALRMKKFVSGSLSAMKSAHSKFTKLFGFGTQAGAAFQKFLHEATNSMGHFAELYGPAVMQNDEAAFYLIESMRTLNISNEQLAYYAQDADVHTGDLNKTLDDTRASINSASSSHSLDFKLLATGFHKLRTNIIDFGHLTSDSIADLTAKATKMGVKVEELTNVFKKFTTFEDAANVSAKLFQSFGMGLDALQLLTASDPGEILEMLSDSMQATGKTFDTLNRHEKKLMQQTTGLSAETLKSIMNYRAQGMSFEEARKKVQDNDPTKEMTKTVKGLTSAIKQIQKIMEFESPFEAFFRGLKANSLANGQSIQSLTGLSLAYDRLYHFGLTLDKKSLISILTPITAVIERLHAIFTSRNFLDSLTLGLTSVGDLFQNITRNFSGNKLNKDMNLLYDRLSSLAYGKSGVQTTIKSQLSSVIDTIDSDSELKKYLVSSGIVSKTTGKVISTVGYDTIMQTLINAGNKLPSAKSDITKIVTTINDQYKDKALDGIGWNKRGIRGRVDRVKQSLNKLWQKSAPWLGPIFNLGGIIMGTLIKGAVVGLTAIFKLLSGEIVDYYDESNSVLLGVMKKAAASQGKLGKFNKGEYGLLDFLGLPTDFNDSVLSRLSAAITNILFSPSFYSIMGSITYAIYDSLLPIANSIAHIIVTQVAEMIDKKGGLTAAAADVFLPELTSSARALESKEPQKVVDNLSKNMKRAQSAAQSQSNKITVNAKALEELQAEVSTGEFDPNDWVGGKIMKTAIGVGAGYLGFLGTSTLLSALGGIEIFAAAGMAGGAVTLGQIAGGIGVAISSLGTALAGGAGFLGGLGTLAGGVATIVGGLLSTPALVIAGATAAIGVAGYLTWDYFFGDNKIIEEKKKKAIAQTKALDVMEKDFYAQLKAKKISEPDLSELKSRWKMSKAYVGSGKRDEHGMIPYEHAYEYPSGYLYPLYSVSKGRGYEISEAEYKQFAESADNVQKFKDGIIKSLPGKGLVFFDGKQNILFDENDTVELIASKKGGALMEYFNQIDRKYENNVKTLRSSLFDNAKETISLIENDIKEKAKISEVIEKTTKVINKIISYNEKDQHLVTNISVQGA